MIKALDELRKRAEVRLTSEDGDCPQHTSQGSRELIQELRTHQIELEIQNEELRRAEQELTHAHERLSDLYDFAPVGYVTINDKGLVEQANMTLAGMLGVERGKLTGQRFSAFVTDEDQDAYYMHRKAVLDSGRRKNAELRLHQPDGSPLWACIESTVSRDSDEGGERLRMVVSDISERKKAEERSFELIQAIGQAGEGVLITDVGGTIEYVNKAFTHITGYTPEEVIGNNPGMLHSGRQDARFYRDMWAEISSKGEWRGKIWNRRKNREVYPERLHITAIRGTDGAITRYCAIYSDISEEQEMEEQLAQSSKMEAVGTLVGGIAHDFNNMLASITGGLYLARADAESLPAVVSQIKSVEKQCFRASDMIAQLLAFARKGLVHIAPLNLTVFMREALSLSTVSIPENIRVQTTICHDNLRIRGDATQMQQILMNLLANARDAVAYIEQPCITVSLTAVVADDDFRQRHPTAEGNYFACLSVTDNGYGISKAIYNKIFDPYFTTKEVGKGSGLGLSMVYGTVHTHHGVIEVVSRVNEGTGFHIYLPLCEDEETVKLEQTGVVEAGGGETILLADDEAGLRDIMTKVLERLGYKVLVASDGQQAVDIFKAQRASIDLVILDVVMPNKGGVAAAREMRALCPDIPVIFSTGYDAEDVLDQESHLLNSTKLCKPVAMKELCSTIRAMLLTSS